MAKLAASYTYTDEELLALYREALAVVSVEGQSYKFQGQEFTRANLPEIREQIDWLESRISKTANGLISKPVNLKRPF